MAWILLCLSPYNEKAGYCVKFLSQRQLYVLNKSGEPLMSCYCEVCSVVTQRGTAHKSAALKSLKTCWGPRITPHFCLSVVSDVDSLHTSSDFLCTVAVLVKSHDCNRGYTQCLGPMIMALIDLQIPTLLLVFLPSKAAFPEGMSNIPGILC